MAGSMFAKLKKQFSTEKPKRTLVIHVKDDPIMERKIIYVPNGAYNNFQLLLKHLADAHGVDLEIVNDK